MLTEALKPINFGTFDQEPWEDYKLRLHLPQDEATLQFFRQVPFDHFTHFNEHYPDFSLDDHRIESIRLTAQEATDQIRYFRSDTLDEWGMQYDEFERNNFDYLIYQSMSKTRTLPFPPILLIASRLSGTGWRECGKPIHLIEGTHRVSYLRRMLARGLAAPESVHEFVLLRPNSDA